MGRTFTQYWTRATWRQTGREEGQPLSHTASDQFEALGVDEEDCVYIVALESGALCLVGRMVVGALGDREYAASVLAYEPWSLKDHLFASECTAARFDRRVPHSVVGQLRYETADGLVPVLPDPSAALTEEMVDGVRILSAASADQLDRILEGERTFTADWPDDSEDEDEDDLEEPEDLRSDVEAAEGDEGDLDDEEASESVLEPLVAYFEEEQYDYELEGGRLLTSFDDEGSEFPAMGTTVGSRIVITTVLPTRVPEDRRAAIAETLLRANGESIDATFLLSFETGTLCCRSVTLNEGGFLESGIIGDVFEDTLERAMVYNVAFGDVISGRKTPLEAVEAAEAELETADNDSDEDAEEDEG